MSTPQDFWQMENALRANPSLTNSVSPDVYEGATMYLAGMSYYEKVGEFDQFNQRLAQNQQLSFWAAGLSKISPARDSSGNLTNGTRPGVAQCGYVLLRNGFRRQRNRATGFRADRSKWPNRTTI